MTARDRSLALLIYDAVSNTGIEAMSTDKANDLRDGLRLLARGGVTDAEEEAYFGQLLDHGWHTTAPYNPAIEEMYTRARDGAAT